MYEEFRYGWIGEHAPRVLQTMGPSNLEKWQLLGLVRIVRPQIMRTPTRVDNRLVKILPRPVRVSSTSP